MTSKMKRVERKLISPDELLVGYVVGNAVIIYKTDNDPKIKLGIRVTYEDFNQDKIHDIQRLEQVLFWNTLNNNSSKLPSIHEYEEEHQIEFAGEILSGRSAGFKSAEHLVDLVDGTRDIILIIPDNVKRLSLSAAEGIADVLSVIYDDWRSHVKLKSNSEFVNGQLKRMKRLF